MTTAGYILVAAALLLAGAAVWWSRWQMVCMIKRLDGMLTRAIDGTFSEQSFNESQFSALESRMARYLSSNCTSARNLQTQKDQINTLISDISHQTKTPVANLRLYTQLLEEQPLTPQAQDCVQAISAQAEKLQSLMEALVKISRLETGILTLHPEKGAIAPVVERSVVQYGPKAEKKGIRLTMGKTAGDAVLDSKWTEEAVCNLLDNAVKYTPNGGAVSVEVCNYDLFSAIRISDTGPGIPEGEQAKIFGRFYRSPSVWQQDGVGIGLYLTRQIAENQGGYVKVGNAPGKGSVFSLYLPRG